MNEISDCKIFDLQTHAWHHDEVFKIMCMTLGDFGDVLIELKYIWMCYKFINVKLTSL
jgi:hypothetical protein